VSRLGEPAPDFVLPAEDGSRFHLASMRGERVLLVFYPGDNTPVCTRQLCDYRDGAESFAGLGVRVVGISADPPGSHRAFKARHDLPFTLLTDADLTVAETFGARGLLGMKRAVFLLDAQGIIRYRHIEALPVFRRAREEIIEAIQTLDESEAETG